MSAGGSLESADVVGEEGALRVRGGVTTVAAARGTNAGAIGRSDTALGGDPLAVAGAAATATVGAAGDNAVEAGRLQGSEFLVGAVARPRFSPACQKRKGLSVIP